MANDSLESESELQYFQEKDEAIALIHEMCKFEVKKFPQFHEELSKVLLKYLEQPQLVQPFIPNLIGPLNDALCILLFECSSRGEAVVLSQEGKMDHLHMLSKVYYLICRVGGFKGVMKYFLHEVNHFESCINLLKLQNHLDHDNWETRYVLLIWLANLCLIPFAICSMDSTSTFSKKVEQEDASTSANNKSTLVSVIIDVCRSYLSDTGPIREAASLCLSTLLTRPDMENSHLSTFMDWAIFLLQSWSTTSVEDRSSLSTDYFLVLGCLHCLFHIFKQGHRFKILPYGTHLLPACLSIISSIDQSTTRKLLVKLIQRIGMNFLPPRLAKWRYMRGNRSLQLGQQQQQQRLDINNNTNNNDDAQSSASASGQVAKSGCVEKENDGGDDEEDDEVPAEMEDVIEQLLVSLVDSNTVVRWSAAKGIGRITMRLSKGMAADIVDAAVLNTFSSRLDSDTHWHGACLALAELSRRGLLLPDRLAEVVPFVQKAIQFDVLKGQHSIGAHVRDAACYVCWAFARAYSASVMAPFTEILTTALLTTALFDREVNCRRAASAAYQETVGRQGHQNVPCGIEIITVADYFSVGNRTNCYTSIATAVVTMNMRLYEPFIEHLRLVKLKHWDKDIRQLTAKALASLTVLGASSKVREDSITMDNNSVMINCCCSGVDLLHYLATTCTSIDLNTRHGALLAAADVLFAYLISASPPSTNTITTSDNNQNIGGLPPTLLTAVMNIVPALEKARLYRGRGGDQVREAVCGLIESMARCKLPIPIKLQVTLVEALNEHLRQPHEKVQSAARNALREFLFTYFSTTTVASSSIELNALAPSERLQKLTVVKYLDGLNNDSNASVTRGCALALGILPARLALFPNGRLDLILDSLATSASPTKRVGGEYDANTCCNCVEALIELAERLTECFLFTSAHMEQCFTILFRATEDYSVDKRGDTGSWSRMMSLKGMERLIYASHRRSAYSSNFLLAPVNMIAPPSSHSCVGKEEEEEGKEENVASGCETTQHRGIRIDTSNGYAMLDRLLISTSEFAVVSVSYPSYSLGDQLLSSSSSSSNSSCNTSSGSNDTTKIQHLVILRKEMCSGNYVKVTVPPHYAAATITSEHLCSMFYKFSDNLAINVISIILKQLSEKLDAVRDVAGNVLLRLLQFSEQIDSKGKANSVENAVATTTTLPPNFRIVQASVILNVLKCHNNIYNPSTSVVVGATDPSIDDVIDNVSFNFDLINWAQPSHVYPIVCSIMRTSSLYFYSVLSGLVISVGGLSETTAKQSALSLHSLCHELKHQYRQQLSEQHQQEEHMFLLLSSSMVRLLNENPKDDRIVVPVMKTIVTLISEGVFDLSASSSKLIVDQSTSYNDEEEKYLTSFLESLCAVASIELKGSSNVTKICSIVELLVQLLSLCPAMQVRYTAMQIILSLLTHKYPKVRKNCAELLYLHLLSSNDTVSNAVIADYCNEETLQHQQLPPLACGYFTSQHDLEAALTVLSCTLWDSMEKDVLIKARMQITRWMGQISQADALQLSLEKRIKSNGIDGNEGNSSKTTCYAKGISIVEDELNSYEALVRDAGY